MIFVINISTDVLHADVAFTEKGGSNDDAPELYS
jgi:hypothetical protein